MSSEACLERGIMLSCQAECGNLDSDHVAIASESLVIVLSPDAAYSWDRNGTPHQHCRQSLNFLTIIHCALRLMPDWTGHSSSNSHLSLTVVVVLRAATTAAPNVYLYASKGQTPIA
jgi:hypothetical protein